MESKEHLNDVSGGAHSPLMSAPLSTRSAGEQSASNESLRTTNTSSSKARRALSGFKSRLASSSNRGHRHTESAPPEPFQRLHSHTGLEDEHDGERVDRDAPLTAAEQRSESARRRKASLRSIKSLARRASSAGNGNRSSAYSQQEEEAPPLPPTSHEAHGSHNLGHDDALPVDKSSEGAQRPVDAAGTRSHIYTPHHNVVESEASKWKDPLSTQRGLILRAVLFTAIAAQASAWLLHWSTGILAAAIGAHVTLKLLERAGKDLAWERGQEERQKSANVTQPETAEWVNHLLARVWPLISAEYFVPFIDLLEDALMQQVPGIVHGCRVEGLDQGTIPLRIVDFKRLPGDDESFSNAEPSRGTSSRDAEVKEEDRTQQQDAPSLDVGDFVNLEGVYCELSPSSGALAATEIWRCAVSFAYRGPQARRRKARSNKVQGLGNPADSPSEPNDGNGEEDTAGVEQIHLLLYMAIGLQKIAAVQVPVWIEMLGIEGKMRVRLQMTPAAPFVKHVAFCFVDNPRIEISAKPLSKRMVIDAMNLPLISSYVLHSIERVIKDFIAPQSYTVDVASLLGAGDGPQNIYALGVIVIILHRANGLAAADVGGTSDPYVGISFARAGKPLYLSRVMARTRDPVWGETSFLLVSPDEVRDHERLRLAVYDADRFSADDELGHVDVSISRLIRRSLHRPGRPGHVSDLEHRQDALAPARRGASVQGTLNYSVGFFRLAQPASGHLATRTHLLSQAASKSAPEEPSPAPPTASVSSASADADAKNPFGQGDDSTATETEETPPLSQYYTGFDRLMNKLGFPIDAELMKERAERHRRISKLTRMMAGEAEATSAPPDSQWPSGVLAFHIHSIDGLETHGMQNTYGSNSKRLAPKTRYTGNEEATGKAAPKFPSSYVQVLINDEAMFRTRTKALDPRPFINAGTERWVADWRKARIDFVVRDQRMRESDPILGLVGLRIADVLQTSSRSSGAWYTLTGGLGFGKIRITLVWRSVELSVPRPLAGWNLGVVEISAARVHGIQRADLDVDRAAHLYFETVGATAETEDVEAESDADKLTFEFPLKSPLRIAVRQRYPSFLYVHLRSDSRVPGRKYKHAYALTPLNRIADDTPLVQRLPLYSAAEWPKLEQHALGAFSATETPPDKGKLRPVLEEMCSAAKDGAGDDHELVEGLKLVGHLDLAFIYHSGIAPEHKALTAGDAEMRFAFENYIASRDAGERSKPKSLSEQVRRTMTAEQDRQPLAPERVSSDSSLETPRGPLQDSSATMSSTATPFDRTSAPPATLHVDTGVDGTRNKVQHNHSRSLPAAGFDSKGKRRSEADGGPDADDLDDEEAEAAQSDEEWDRSRDSALDLDEDPTSPEGRRAKQRSLARQHKGAAQVKGVRSLMWIKQNAEDGIGRIKVRRRPCERHAVENAGS